MGIVNRYAVGLLNILDSQAQGDTPSSMSDVIAPTMDLGEIMLASKKSELHSQTVTLVAVGVTNVTTVPSGEQWFLRYIGGEAIARDAVASTFRWGIYVQNQAGNSYPIAVSDSNQTAVIGAQLAVAVHLPRPLVLFGGDQITCQLANASGIPVLGWNFNISYGYDLVLR